MALEANADVSIFILKGSKPAFLYLHLKGPKPAFLLSHDRAGIMEERSRERKL